MIVEIVSIGYGVVSMIGWGCGDFLAKRAVGSVDYYKLLLYTQLVSLVPVFLLAAIFTPPLPSSLGTIIFIIASGICSFSAVFFFFKALSVGKASVVAPVTSTSAIVAIALSFAVLGETLSFLQASCIALVMSGLLIISVGPSSEKKSDAGVPYALACMFSAGLSSILIKLVSADIGAIGTLFFNRSLVSVMLLMMFPFFGSRLCGRVSLKPVVLVGLSEFVGYFGFVVGIAVGIVSIVTPISSSSPAVTVILAQVFLKEELTQIQKMAVLLIMLGILLLSILSSS